MFSFALIIGIYSYLIFFLGLAGLLYRDLIVWVTVAFWLVVVWLNTRSIRGMKRMRFPKNKLLSFLGLLLSLQAGVNLIGALGPELAFDALWYHLTLPKLWLINHSIEFIPGGLLYYSAMPKLAETLYAAGLAFGSEITVKVIHWLFGLLTCLALYKLSRKFFTPFISLVAVLIFYANLVVAWESITAYIDLVRAFFEVMTLWAFVNWIEVKKQKWLIWSAMMVGLAITTKLLAVGSLAIFALIMIGRIKGKRWVKGIRDVGLFVLIAFVVPMPWLVFSYLNTGNPVYPFFSGIYPISPEPVSITGFFREIWSGFMQSADPSSPVYMMLLPLILWLFYKSRGAFGMTTLRVIGLYALLAIIVWYFTPRTGGGRFLLPYLPAFSLLCAGIIQEVLTNKKSYGFFLGKFLLVILISLSVISIGYRFAANSKYLPVIVGIQSKDQFLTENLNFSFGDFYDTDGYFRENIKPTDIVLLYGFHNLYYVDFPFIDSSWVSYGDTFNYIATQNTELPPQYYDWILVYENEQTMVKLYQKPQRLYTQK